MPVSETKLNQFNGIWSSVDAYSRAPKGSFRVADNVIFKNPGLVEPRRGVSTFLPGNTFAAPPQALFTSLRNSLAFGMLWLADRTFFSYIYQNQDPLNTIVNAQAAPFNPGAAEFGGTVPTPHPAAARVRFAQANKNTYAITAYGLLKSEDNLKWRHTQMPFVSMENPNAQGYGTRATIVDKTVNNWLPQGSQVGYKCRIARKGVNGDFVFGQPSPPIVCQNPLATGAARAVRVIPAWGPMAPSPSDGGFMEIFRTKTVPIVDALGNAVPLPFDYYKVAEIASPEMNQADGYSRPPENAAIVVSTNQYYEDILVDQGLGPPLETNPTDGDTQAVAFAPAPAAADIAFFKNRMYVANYIDVERLVLPITGTGTNGILPGDTLTIDGLTYVWQNAAGFDYLKPVLVTGTGSVFLNLLASANSLAGCINYGMAAAWLGQYFSSIYGAPGIGPRTIYQSIRATYIGDTSQPGSLLLEREVPGAPQFAVSYVSVGRPNAYGIPTGKTSDHNVQVAGLRFSEEGEPESFPLANDQTIGDPGKAILRIVGTRDSLWIFKEDGLFRVTDDGNGPVVTLFDPNIRLIAPDSAVALNNEVYCLCTQGVLRINEQGKDNISTALQRELLEAIAETAGADRIYRVTTGTAYESEGQYILSIPAAVNSQSNYLHYVYHVDSQAWSTYSFRAGLLNGGVDQQWDTLMLVADTGAVWQERKAYISLDHSDASFNVAIPAAAIGTAATTLVFTAAPGIRVGDLLRQFQAAALPSAYVRTVSNDGKTITLQSAPTDNWDASAFSVLPGITSTLTFLPIVGEDELLAKVYDSHIRLSFQYFDHLFYDGQVATDERPVPEDIANGRVPATIRWGTDTGTWGSTLWGEDATNVVSRMTMTEEHARGAELDLTLKFACAAKRFELAAIAIGQKGDGTDRVIP